MSSLNKRKIRVTLASAAILLGSLSACGKNETAASLIAEARAFQLKGETSAALIQLKNAVAKNPNDVEARLALGELTLAMGDPVSAEKEFRKALSLGAPVERVTPGLAAALTTLSQFQKALDVSQAASASGSAELLTTRGDALLGLGQNDKAKASYEQALAAKPDHTAAMLGLARLALTQKDVAAATSIVNQAVDKNPQDTDAWMFKGSLLRAQGKADDSLAAYDKVLAIKPAHRTARVDRAYVEIGAGKYDAAKVDLDAARKTTPGSLMVVYTQALLDYSQGKHAAALDSLQKVLRQQPNHMPSVLLAGAVQLNLGNLEQAEQHLKKYLESDPKSLYARKMMASTLLKAGRASDALGYITPALQDAPADSQSLALAGEAFLQKREFAKATEYFQKASKLEPKAASLHTSLAISKLGQGDSTTAIDELELSTKLNADSPKAGMLLVLTEMRLKHLDKALSAVKALETAHPKNPMVQNLKGGVYLARDEPANARASFEAALALQPGYMPAISNLAQMALKEKKPEVAKQLYLGALEKDKKNLEAMTALASLAATQGHQEEATQWLEKASSENPASAPAAMKLVGQYLRTGEKQKALTMARKAVVADPANLALLDLQAQAQIANNDNNAALESYSKLAMLAPKSPQAQFRLADVHARLKNDAAAGEDLKKALQLQPNYLEAQLAQAQLAMRARKPELALAIAKDVQKQRPKEVVGFMLEGDLLMAQGKTAPALRAAEQAFAISKSPTMLLRQYSLLTKLGNIKEADARMAQWRKEHPTDLLTGVFLAEASLNKKDYKAAIAQFEQLLKQEPRNPGVLNNLAWAYQQENDPRALPTAEQALALAANNPAVMDTVGTILSEQGNLTRAVPLLQKVVTLAPAEPEFRFHLAQALIKSGDKPGARRELEKVLAESKDFPKIDNVRSLLKQL